MDRLDWLHPGAAAWFGGGADGRWVAVVVVAAYPAIWVREISGGMERVHVPTDVAHVYLRPRNPAAQGADHPDRE